MHWINSEQQISLISGADPWQSPPSSKDSRRLLSRQLALRDEALDADPTFSGMPPRFIEETWINWLPQAVNKPFYRDQLTAHVTELERQIANLSREIELQSGGLLDKRDAAVDLRHRLMHLLETS